MSDVLDAALDIMARDVEDFTPAELEALFSHCCDIAADRDESDLQRAHAGHMAVVFKGALDGEIDRDVLLAAVMSGRDLRAVRHDL